MREARAIHLSLHHRLARVIRADLLEEFAVARVLRVGDDDVVKRAFLGAEASETNLNHGLRVPLTAYPEPQRADAEEPRMVESEIGARRHPVTCPPAEQISGPDTLAGAGPRKLLGRFGSVKGPGWRPAGWARLALALASAWLVLGCSDRERSAPTARTPQATPALRLVAFTDLAGALEPCGCQSRPLGGLDRAASMLDQLRADKTPVLLVAAGDVFFGNPPEGAVAGADATTQEIWKAETLVDVLGKLGLAAAAPGARDLSYGREVFDKLAARAKFRLLPDAKSASWLTTVGSTKVGLLGASSNQVPDPAQLQREVKSLRDAGAQVVIALFSMDQRSGRRLAGSLTGVDFVVQGGLDNESTPPP